MAVNINLCIIYDKLIPIIQSFVQQFGKDMNNTPSECILRPEVKSLIARIERNIARRAQALEHHNFERRIVVDRVVSSELADVPGMDKWLQRNRMIKDNYAQQEVHDEYSHGTIRRIDIHQKYTPQKKSFFSEEKSKE